MGRLELDLLAYPDRARDDLPEHGRKRFRLAPGLDRQGMVHGELGQLLAPQTVQAAVAGMDRRSGLGTTRIEDQADKSRARPRRTQLLGALEYPVIRLVTRVPYLGNLAGNAERGTGGIDAHRALDLALQRRARDLPVFRPAHSVGHAEHSVFRNGPHGVFVVAPNPANIRLDCRPQMNERRYFLRFGQNRGLIHVASI